MPPHSSAAPAHRMTQHSRLPPFVPPGQPFPPVAQARADGLLAIGPRPSVQRLLEAYRQGIFPWYDSDLVPLWWSPPARAGLDPAALRVPRRLARTMRQLRGPARGGPAWRITLDSAFAAVVEKCASRPDEGESWITPGLREGFLQLHRAGLAHSLEVWCGRELAGGVYGLSVGRVFCAESKFHRAADASKIALVALARLLHRLGYSYLDCQLSSPHLRQFGVGEIARGDYLALLRRGLHGAEPAPWPGGREMPGLWLPAEPLSEPLAGPKPDMPEPLSGPEPDTPGP